MRLTLALAILNGAASAALADTISQSITYDWNADQGLQIGVFDAFDDAGGARQLTGVSFALDATTRWDVTCLNYETTPFGPDDWFAEGFANFNVLMGDFGAGAERIAGLLEFHGLTGDLGAGTGGPFGDPGDPAVSASFTGDILATFDLDASEFAYFTGAPVNAFLLAFTDAYVDGPDGAPGIIVPQTDLLASAGKLTLNYEYVNVPAPGALPFALAGLALAARRRRRG